jgi:hypothetical protein
VNEDLVIAIPDCGLSGVRIGRDAAIHGSTLPAKHECTVAVVSQTQRTVLTKPMTITTRHGVCPLERGFVR